MNRSDFIDFLARCVADESIHLTEAQAETLKERFDAGDIQAENLPLTLAVAIPPVADLTIHHVLLAMSEELPPAGTTPDELQGAFKAYTERLAVDLARTGAVTTWHQAMIAAVRDHTLLQAMLGYGGLLPAVELSRIGTGIREQLGFLSRFADETACRVLLGALSE